MDESKKNFNYFEIIFLKISLGLLGSGVVIFSFMLIFADRVSDFSNQLSGLIVILLISSITSFLIAIFRIFKFIFVVNKKNDGSTITRSIISFFTSPFAIIIYYIILLVLALSSCSIQ